MSQHPRWAIFNQSIISDLGNPDAYLLRALGTHLAARGHEAIFFEERGNPALRSLLKISGARAIDDFRSEHPEIEYRTIDPRPSSLLAEWLIQALATFDLVLVQRDAPLDLVYWLGKFTRRHLQTYLLDTGFGNPPTELQLTQIEPQNFSGVIVGETVSLANYRDQLPEEKIQVLDTLDGPDALGRDRPPEEWSHLATILADVTLERFFRDRMHVTAGVQPNGHIAPEH